MKNVGTLGELQLAAGGARAFFCVLEIVAPDAKDVARGAHRRVERDVAERNQIVGSVPGDALVRRERDVVAQRRASQSCGSCRPSSTPGRSCPSADRYVRNLKRLRRQAWARASGLESVTPRIWLSEGSFAFCSSCALRCAAAAAAACFFSISTMTLAAPSVVGPASAGGDERDAPRDVLRLRIVVVGDAVETNLSACRRGAESTSEARCRTSAG